MKRGSWFVSVPAVLVCIAAASCARLAGGEREPRSSFAEAAARRPRPDLRTLAERCAPGREGADHIAAFHDLLKLREQPDPRAVPVLERVLADHQASNYIHRYAAAQALFAIGTPQAQQILARYLLSPGYPALQGIRYAFHHEMSPALRDDFISRYHLHNLAQDLSLVLAITARADASLLVSVTATNTSAAALRLLDPGHSLETMLFLRSENGAFVPAQGLARKEFEQPKVGWGWIHLQPGARHEWRIELRRRSVRELERPYPGLARNSQMVLDCDRGYFDIRRPGRFQAIAIFEQEELARTLPGPGDGTACWTGRAVSAPVPVEIRR